jgi:peptidoglycan/LPS O-acetylase OafA/YrhL
MVLENRQSANSHIVEYRPDLDGMRAIAVLSVIGFHLHRSTIPGGYLGVDMFFVLSGFLITSIIWREALAGNFSIALFYDRRIRRIMPALLVLLVVTTIVATLLLLPADLIGYAKSLIAALAFVANVYFWRDSDYFSRAAEEKPLLHLWSLAVEEQFYILFPLLLVLLARRLPKVALPVVIALTLGSLAAYVLAVFIGAGSPAFFLLPTRAWELGFGAAIALLQSRTHLPRVTVAPLAALGVALVAIGIARPLDPYGLMPAALPVVVGTTLIILTGRGSPSLVNRALAAQPLVFIGLISYSLYLWHWPIIVAGQYYLVRDFNSIEMLLAVALMGAAAIASWHFVERPFRSSAIPIRRVRWTALGGCAAMAAAAAVLVGSGGLPQRMSPDVAEINASVGTNYRCPISEYLSFGFSRACLMNLPSRDSAHADVVLVGNSHAQMYAPIWSSILEARHLHGLLVPVNLCLPTIAANVSRECAETARRNIAELTKLRRARVVVVGLTWEHHDDHLVDPSGQVLDNRGNRALVAALDDLIARLQGAGKVVILIGPIAEPGWDIASIVSRERAFGHASNRRLFRPAAEFEQAFGAAIRHFAARGDIGFARPDLVQCRGNRCDFMIDGRSLFADSNHLAAPQLPRFRASFESALIQGLASSNRHY